MMNISVLYCYRYNFILYKLQFKWCVSNLDNFDLKVTHTHIYSVCYCSDLHTQFVFFVSITFIINFYCVFLFLILLCLFLYKIQYVDDELRSDTVAIIVVQFPLAAVHRLIL